MITRPSRARRAGLTLTEALIALFVAAIGMIALMTLFPLGALQMAQAIKDERTSQLAMQADAKMRWHWQKYVVDSDLDWYAHAMTDPDDLRTSSTDTTNPNGTTWSQANNNLAQGNEVSYPVLVDPIGWTAWSGTTQSWVAGLNTQSSALPRRSLFKFPSSTNPFGDNQGLNTTAKAVAYCSLLDDLTYTTDGRPDPLVTQPAVERQGRYNWLAVVRRPNMSMPGNADLTIVVFDGRAPGYPAPKSERRLPDNTSAFVQFTPGSSSLTVSYDGERPPVTAGRWVMDATTQITEGTVTRNLRHANFYRVVSVNDETPGQLVLELQTPIKRSDNLLTAYDGTLVVLYATSEVFERPPLNAQVGP